MKSLKFVAQVPEDDKHCEDVETVVLHDDKVYTAADEGRVKIWSRDLKLLHELKAHDYAITHLMVMNNFLYTASMDMTIKKWDMKTWDLVGAFKGHEESIRRLDNDGKFIFAGDEKGEVRMWTQEGKLKRIYEVIEEVWDMRIEGPFVYCLRDRDLVVTQRIDDSELHTVVTTSPGRFPLYINHKHVAFMNRAGKNIQILDKKPPTFPHKYDLQEHELIVTALGGWDNYLISGGWDGKLVAWDINSGKQVSQCSIGTTPSAIAADQDSIFVVGSDGYLGKFQLT